MPGLQPNSHLPCLFSARGRQLLFPAPPQYTIPRQRQQVSDRLPIRLHIAWHLHPPTLVTVKTQLPSLLPPKHPSPRSFRLHCTMQSLFCMCLGVFSTVQCNADTPSCSHGRLYFWSQCHAIHSGECSTLECIVGIVFKQSHRLMDQLNTSAASLPQVVRQMRHSKLFVNLQAAVFFTAAEKEKKHVESD